MKAFCECCGSDKDLKEREVEQHNRTFKTITICFKCVVDYKKGDF